MSRADAARAISHYLAGDPEPLIVADWPEDIAYFNALLVTGPGVMAEVPGLSFQFMPLSGFSTAANSKVPHNALHDARSLRDHVLSTRIDLFRGGLDRDLARPRGRSR